MTLYNMRIEEYHTYFVGSAAWGFSVWAHNASCGIQGNAQVTGTVGHDVVSADIAAAAAAGEGVVSVHLNQTLNTITNGAVDSALRPDVAIINASGLIDLIEVQSNSQSFKSLERKVDGMLSLLGGMAGLGKVIPYPY